MQSSKLILPALLAASLDSACVSCPDHAPTVERAPHAAVAAVQEDTQRFVYLADRHIHIDPRDPVAIASQESQYAAFTQALSSGSSIALVQEGAFTESEFLRMENRGYTPDVLKDMFTKENYTFEGGAYLASARFVSENAGRVHFIGTETREDWNKTYLAENKFTQGANFFNESENAICPTIGGSATDMRLSTAMTSIRRGDKNPQALGCYCEVRALFNDGLREFIHERTVAAASREAATALGASEEVVFIVAGTNHYPEIQRQFNEHDIPLETVSAPQISLGGINGFPEPMEDLRGTCSSWEASPAATAYRTQLAAEMEDAQKKLESDRLKKMIDDLMEE